MFYSTCHSNFLCDSWKMGPADNTCFKWLTVNYPCILLPFLNNIRRILPYYLDIDNQFFFICSINQHMYNATSIMLLWIFISPLQYFSQPRILMAMARDGLLPSFFSDVHKTTQVPVKSTIVTGICAASLAFFMDVSQLAGMVWIYRSLIWDYIRALSWGSI